MAQNGPYVAFDAFDRWLGFWVALAATPLALISSVGLVSFRERRSKDITFLRATSTRAHPATRKRRQSPGQEGNNPEGNSRHYVRDGDMAVISTRPRRVSIETLPHNVVCSSSRWLPSDGVLRSGLVVNW